MIRAESPLDRAERIGAELRAATQEAAGVLKDLRAAMKEARAQVDGYLHDSVQTALDLTTTDIQAKADAFAADATADMNRFAVNAVASAESRVKATATIDHLCKLVAVVVGAMTIYTPDGPTVDISRPIDWDRIDEIQG